MFIFPWVDGAGNWLYVQNVWDRWQSLNVGMLAFISSITAFNISRFNANKQRERDFLAAKAFLPAALSELCAYFKLSATILIRAWETDRNNRLDIESPSLPENYKQVFGQCIKFAEPDVGDYLSKILVRLQVHDARLMELISQYGGANHPNRHTIISYLYRLGELQAFMNKLFPFARNEEEFDSSRLQWEDFRNAFGNLDVWYQDYRIDENMNLEDFTRRAINRGK